MTMKISDEEKKQFEEVRLAVLKCIERDAQAGNSHNAKLSTDAYTSLVMTTSYIGNVK